MAAGSTTLGRAILQEYGSNPESWGNELNEGALQRLDDMWGFIAVTVNGSHELTVEDFIEDEARRFGLILTGTGGTLTAPALPKPYFIVNNCSGNVTVTPAEGTGAVVRAGKRAFYWCDGTDGFVWDAKLSDILPAEDDISMGGNKILDLAAGTNATDAASLANRLNQFAAPNANVSMDNFKLQLVGDATAGTKDAPNMAQVEAMIASAESISLPSAVGNGGKFLRLSQAEVPEWAGILPQIVNGNVTMSSGGSYRIISGTPVTLTLPASPITGDAVTILDGESISLSNTHTIARNGNTIMGEAEDLVVDVEGIQMSLWFNGSDWRLF